MTTPHPIEPAEVMAYVDGELPTDRTEQVRAHLEACTACRALVDDLGQVSTRLQAWDVGDAPSRLEAAVSEALRPGATHRPAARSWWPRFSGFPGWGLAAASLAGVALLAVAIVPSVVRQDDGFSGRDRVADADAMAANEMARAERVAVPGEAREEDAARRAAAEATAQPPVAVVSPPPSTPPPPVPTLPAPPPPPVSAPVPTLGETRQSMTAQRIESGAAADLTFRARSSRGFVVAAADFDLARTALAEAASALDGRLEEETTSGEGTARQLTVILRVPVAREGDVLDALAAIGTVRPLVPALPEVGEPADLRREVALLEKATTSEDGTLVGVAIRLVVRNRPAAVRH